MGAFLLKDVMLLLRDRSELLVLLAMPFLLIAILGFSLRGIFSGDLEALEMDVALVDQDDEAQAVEAIQNEIDAMGIPQPNAEALKQAAASISPQTMVVTMLESENLQELITLQRMDQTQAEESLEGETIDAAIIIPAGFAEDSIRNMLLGSSGGAELQMIAADLSSPQADVLQSVLDEFVQTVNFEAAIFRLTGGESGAAIEPGGGVETITARQPVSSFQYYTIGMAVMFVLFVGSTIAAQANLEQKHMVFDRILLSNRPPLLYLGSKALAAASIVLIQLTLLFGLSALIFRTFSASSLSFWIGIALISVVLSLAVGGLAALMTSMTLRLQSDAVPAIFSGGVIALMAFLGGSFMPMDGTPDILQSIGNWTPNGAAMTAYFSWLLNPDTGNLAGPLMRIGILAFLFMLFALALFPKKGGVL